VILFGSSYWSPLMDWLTNTVAANGKVSAPDLNLIRITDDPAEAASIITSALAEAKTWHPTVPTP
jgi:predicted Rossmann-fold nucleotide-binding protein